MSTGAGGAGGLGGGGNGTNTTSGNGGAGVASGIEGSGGGGGGYGGGGGGGIISGSIGGGGGGGSFVSSTVFNGATPTFNISSNKNSKIAPQGFITGFTMTNPYVTTQIACGSNHSLGIIQGGNLYAWGDNSKGQLGTNTPDASHNLPQLVLDVQSGTEWSKIAGGDKHTLGLLDNGTLYAWGDNTYGQLGNGTLTQSNSPYLVSNVSNGTIWTDIVCGANHSLAIRNDGSLYAWGDNTQGQLNGIIGSSTNATPILVYSTSKWVNVSAGDYHSKGIQTNGQLYTWGDNSQGQLGTGTTTDPYPTQPFSFPTSIFNPLLTLT